MLGQNILTLLITLQGVLCYYFYHPGTNQILNRLSLENVPSNYKVIPPPKSRRRKLQTGSIDGICTEAGFSCTIPYDESLTYQFECDADFQCPRQYKCCPQKCFRHKICSKYEVKEGPAKFSVNGRQNYNRPGTCEKWPYNCPKPYDYSFSSAFKCERDRQCPRSFKCCQHSCFSHRICSKAVFTNASGEASMNPISGAGRIQYENHHVPAELSNAPPNRIQNTGYTIRSDTEPPEEKIPEVTTEETTTEQSTTEDTTTEQPTTEETTTDETTTEETTTEETTTEEPTTAETTTEQTTTEETTTEETTTEEKAMEAVTNAETTPELTTTVETITAEETTNAETTTEVTTVTDEYDEKLVVMTNTVDPNSIIPEYSDYYYHYDASNESSTDDYYDEEDD